MTAKLISAFVFATRIVQFLFYLNPKFQASSTFLCLYRPVYVGPVRKPHCWFSHEAAHIELRSHDPATTSATTPNADEIDAVPFLGDDSRDTSLPAVAKESEFEADDKVTEIDQNSTLSESSTITTGGFTIYPIRLN